MTASTAKSSRVLKFTAVILSVALSLFVGFMAQASSLNYQRLFLTILPLAVVDLTLIVFVWAAKGRGKKWVVTVPGFLALASYLEMACRVFFGIRLL